MCVICIMAICMSRQVSKLSHFYIERLHNGIEQIAKIFNGALLWIGTVAS